MKYLFVCLTIVIAMSAWVRPAQASFILHKSNTLGLTNGLVGWWTFDGKDMAVDRALDKSGTGNYGTLTGGPVRTIGKIGQGLSFDGVDDEVQISSTYIVTSDDWTVSAWVKPTSYTGGDASHKYIFLNADDVSAGGVSGFQLFMQINTGEPAVNATVGTNSEETLVGASPLSITQWTHVVGVKNGTLLTLYVNNVPKNLVLSSATMDYTADDPETRIGQTSGGNGEFPGLIDDVRTYNRALSADEIKRLYNIGGTVKLNSSQNLNNNNSLQNGLVGWWTFDGKDMAGNYAFDKSGNGNRGTLTGTNGVPVRTIGKIGQGLSFDGVDDFVTMGDINSLEGFSELTLSGWVYFSALTDSTLFGKEHVYKFSLDSSNVFYWSTGDGSGSWTDQVTVASAFTVNTWYHLVGTYSAVAGRKVVYINGVSRNSSVISGPIGSFDKAVAVGARDTGGGFAEFTKGKIDDVRIYNRALNADEIKRLYNLGGTVKLNSTQNLNNNNSLQNGLVGWWTFDGKDMAGNYAFDKSGNGNRGTLTAGPVRTVGRIGQALQFDGVDDWIDFGDPVPLRINGDLTIAAWVKTTNAAKGEMMIITQTAGGNNRNYQLHLTTNADLQFTHGSGSAQSNYATAGTSLADGKWHHVAFKADYPSGTYYIDGKSVKNITMSFDIVDTDTNPYLVGGGNIAFPSTMFEGLIDDVRVYNRALSADEIKRLYNMGR